MKLLTSFMGHFCRFSIMRNHTTSQKQSKLKLSSVRIKNYHKEWNVVLVKMSAIHIDYEEPAFFVPASVSQVKVRTCGMIDIFCRRRCRPISEVRKPSMLIFPSGSTSRNKADTRELLPAPVRPTMPTYREKCGFRSIYIGMYDLKSTTFVGTITTMGLKKLVCLRETIIIYRNVMQSKQLYLWLKFHSNCFWKAFPVVL